MSESAAGLQYQGFDMPTIKFIAARLRPVSDLLETYADLSVNSKSADHWKSMPQTELNSQYERMAECIFQHLEASKREYPDAFEDLKVKLTGTKLLTWDKFSDVGSDESAIQKAISMDRTARKNQIQVCLSFPILGNLWAMRFIRDVKEGASAKLTGIINEHHLFEKMKTALTAYYRGQPDVFQVTEVPDRYMFHGTLADIAKHKTGGNSEDDEEDDIDQSSEDEGSASDSESVIALQEQLDKNELETHSFLIGEYDPMSLLADLNNVDWNQKIDLWTVDKIKHVRKNTVTREGVMQKYRQVFEEINSFEITGSTFTTISSMTKAEKAVLPEDIKHTIALICLNKDKKLYQEMKDILSQDKQSAEEDVIEWLEPAKFPVACPVSETISDWMQMSRLWKGSKMENFFSKSAQRMRTALETLKEREQILLQALADRPGSERVVAMITKLFEKMDRQTKEMNRQTTEMLDRQTKETNRQNEILDCQNEMLVHHGVILDHLFSASMSKLETGKDGFPNKRQRTEREGPLETENKNANSALDFSEEASLKQMDQDLSTTLDGMETTMRGFLETTKKHLDAGNVEGLVHALALLPSELCQWIKNDDDRIECYSDEKMKEWIARFNGQAPQGAEQTQPGQVQSGQVQQSQFQSFAANPSTSRHSLFGWGNK
ncbi:unnamed protein product [Clonostachys rhizophaga]|uniref:Uncharacterized protein n=1 Tax=Clonostachys rhizophaga TaxID=160324 RepID=A0A9N9VAD7_9HYPO|nr:unnamed protein product [Clonostachys rhizophaga]